MKSRGARTSFISRSLELLSKRIETPIATVPAKPTTLLQSEIEKFTEQNQWHKEYRRRQTLKKAVAVIRSKSKTQRLMELCEEVMHITGKSDAWFVKQERFFRSPVWKLVSDEAIRKAHFRCECWGCTKRAVKVYLLEFPEEHLDPNFNWMKRDNILIALCSHHHDIMHGFVMKRVVRLDRQFDSAVAISFPRALAHRAQAPGLAAPRST